MTRVSGSGVATGTGTLVPVAHADVDVGLRLAHATHGSSFFRNFDRRDRAATPKQTT
jgi:hypothetical protein